MEYLPKLRIRKTRLIDWFSLYYDQAYVLLWMKIVNSINTNYYWIMNFLLYIKKRNNMPHVQSKSVCQEKSLLEWPKYEWQCQRRITSNHWWLEKFCFGIMLFGPGSPSHRSASFRENWRKHRRSFRSKLISKKWGTVGNLEYFLPVVITKI